MSQASTFTPGIEQNLDNPVSERDHTRGPDDAPVTLVQYGDFECEDCGDVYPILKELRDRLGSQFQYVFRHFPLTEVHPHAKHAAEAAEAAAAQDAFWAMHDRLYEHQDMLTDDDLERHAVEIGLDTDQFMTELHGREHEERVQEDFEDGIDNGVNSTPAFFINGERYGGRYTINALHRAIAEAGDLSDEGVAGGSSSAGVSGAASSDDLRETIERSQRGAPAAGAAVRDRFSADEIFQRIVATADEEFSRSNRLLFLSGLSAGLVMSLSFLGSAALTALVSENGEPALAVGYLLYPLGFIAVALGSYQLFTENTLTPVTLVMTRIASIPALLRVWGVVFVANVLGAALSAYVLAKTGVFSPQAMEVAPEFGYHFIHLSWSAIFWKGVFAGGIIAGMVWLIHAARDTAARVLLIFILTYTVAAGGLAHCIVSSVEVLYVVFNGGASISEFLWGFLAPATLGNTAGGVVLVALLNYSQTRERRIQNRDCRVLELGWREWLLGNHIGRPITPSFSTSGEDSTEAD
jgi:formate/nitrite transporter FocA (FNT family)/2-hydroxychromene-2-carboxylate isomerase